ncbi:MAG TPA: YeeE/YedE family protein [Telluria sp.]|jgi:hypothetical protein
MKTLMAFLTGLLFGLGLIMSGMTDPFKVLGFLDLAGRWDPSLVFVMGGALAVGGLAFPFIVRRTRSVLGETMCLPAATRVDRRLVLGSVTFGVGWGLAGYCPGPALVSLAQGGAKPLIFFLAMMAGMLLFEGIERLRNKPA